MDYPCGCCTSCGPLQGYNCFGMLELDSEFRCLHGNFVGKTEIICRSTRKGIYGSKNVGGDMRMMDTSGLNSNRHVRPVG